MNSILDQAITILKQGGIIIYPTDTAFGIGCDMTNSDAVNRLFEIRKRPTNKATPVLVSGISMALEYVTTILPDVKEKLIDPFWPGALTIVLPCITEKVPSLARGGGKTIGVRMPNHEVPLTIINGIGVPLLGPSANFAGEKTPFRLSDIDKELISLVDFVIDGKTNGKTTSTVVDCTKTPWEILRAGGVTLKL